MRRLLILLVLVLTSVTSAQKKNPANLPHGERIITTSDKVRLFTKTEGIGPVCLFVHGGPGAWSKSFEDMGGKSLEKKLTMVYFDQRGSGRSDSSATKSYGIDRMVEDIEDIRKNVGVEKILLLSHSFGGMAAFSYAKKYPQHTAGLILANSTLYLSDSMEQQINYINTLANVDIKIENNDVFSAFSKAREVLSVRGLEYKMLSEDKATVDKVDAIDNAPRSRSYAQNVWGFSEYYNDFTKETAAVGIPVLVITGTKDYAVGPEHYKRFQFPNQKIAAIDGGHLLYYENNQEFSKAIFAFVRSL